MVAALAKNETKQLSITMKIRKSAPNGKVEALNDIDGTSTESKTKRLRFPGKSEEEAWQFSM